jgi:NAD(P)H-hydrate epimerase
MATGGTGDVLTGVITALVCQGLAPFDAARLGVHAHGLAGDLAAEKLGQVSLIASDLVGFLPAAFEALH